jgi:peptide/nickel transport system ATP-binding protein/peptide/nickel transport system permease protein
MTTVAPVAAQAATSPGVNPRFLRRLLRRPVAIACCAYLAVLVGVAIVAPIAISAAGPTGSSPGSPTSPSRSLP